MDKERPDIGTGYPYMEYRGVSPIPVSSKYRLCTHNPCRRHRCFSAVSTSPQYAKLDTSPTLEELGRPLQRTRRLPRGTLYGSLEYMQDTLP